MSLVREIRRKARLVVGPVVGITLVAYFSYHLVQGDRGLVAWTHLSQEIKQAKATLAETDEQRRALGRRVKLLRSDHLDPDMLDERARGTLNLAGPNDRVIFFPPTAPAAP